MKLFSSFVPVLTVLNLAAAYPSVLLRDIDLSSATAADWKLIKREIEAEKLKSRSLGFDAGLQYINTKGVNKFVAPNLAAGDQRGPCPALNALANHNYLPHNGVGTINDFIQSTFKVFGLGLDIATIIGVYGAVTTGNGAVWSIGGKTNAVPGIPLLLEKPGGISNSHNIYEGDASPTRGDLYQYGEAYKLKMHLFEALYNRQPNQATADYGHTGEVTLLHAFRADRIAQSKAENPYFFAAPVPFLVAGSGAYQFISLFANHSSEHPEGRLDQETLKSFFAVAGSGPGQFQYREGWEKIPDNWYRRPIGFEYDQPKFFLDIAAGDLQYPEFVALGGNTGSVNSFAGISLTNLTGGVYNLQDLSDPVKFWCFVHEAMLVVTPDFLAPIFRTLLGTIFGAFGCPVLAQYWDAKVFDIFPGSNL